MRELFERRAFDGPDGLGETLRTIHSTQGASSKLWSDVSGYVLQELRFAYDKARGFVVQGDAPAEPRSVTQLAETMQLLEDARCLEGGVLGEAAEGEAEGEGGYRGWRGELGGAVHQLCAAKQAGAVADLQAGKLCRAEAAIGELRMCVLRLSSLHTGAILPTGLTGICHTIRWYSTHQVTGRLVDRGRYVRCPGQPALSQLLKEALEAKLTVLEGLDAKLDEAVAMPVDSKWLEKVLPEIQRIEEQGIDADNVYGARLAYAQAAIRELVERLDRQWKQARLDVDVEAATTAYKHLRALSRSAVVKAEIEEQQLDLSRCESRLNQDKADILTLGHLLDPTHEQSLAQSLAGLKAVVSI